MRISDWSSDVCYSDLNRKNRPYIVRSPDYCAPFPEYRVKVTPRPAFQLFGRGGRILDRQVAAQDHALRDRLAFGVGEGRIARLPPEHVARHHAIDRKSTRLNSSH